MSFLDSTMCLLKTCYYSTGRSTPPRNDSYKALFEQPLLHKGLFVLGISLPGGAGGHNKISENVPKLSPATPPRQNDNESQHGVVSRDLVHYVPPAAARGPSASRKRTDQNPAGAFILHDGQNCLAEDAAETLCSSTGHTKGSEAERRARSGK